MLFFLKASAPEHLGLPSYCSFHYEKREHLAVIIEEKKPENEKPRAYKPFHITTTIKKSEIHYFLKPCNFEMSPFISGWGAGTGRRKYDSWFERVL